MSDGLYPVFKMHPGKEEPKMIALGTNLKKMSEGDEKIQKMTDAPKEIVSTSKNTKQVEPDKNWKKYTVKTKDTFDKIAQNFGISSGADLAFWNNMDYTNPGLPQEGDVLSLPFIDDKYIDNVEKKLEEMKKNDKVKGWNVAFDNLYRFRKGVGGTKTLDAAWLKSFEAVTDAMKDIQEHFEDAFNAIANDMKDNQVISGDGHGKEKGNQFWWEGFIDPPYKRTRNELSFACGASTLTGLGTIKLKKEGSTVIIGGVVEYKFHDPYDWHGGNTVPISWTELFYDSDMLLLQEFRGGKPFLMESKWEQKVTGTIDVDIMSPNDLDIKWSDI